MDYVLEVCVDNIISARNAEDGGADRIELCQALEVGGLTPSLGLMRKIKEMLDIPVFIMIRARSGNFWYNELEVEQMKENIKAALSVGIDGFVLGALREYEVDKEVCCSLINECHGLPVTFHRAFDLIQDPFQAVTDIIELGCKRILTSGQAPTAYLGIRKIKDLVEKAGSKIIIMPGCGINEKNLEEIKSVTQAKEYHSSAQRPNSNVIDTNVVKGTTFHSTTSSEVVKRLKNILANNNCS